MAESIDPDKEDTFCPLSCGNSEGPLKRAGITKGYLKKRQQWLRMEAKKLLSRCLSLLVLFF